MPAKRLASDTLQRAAEKKSKTSPARSVKELFAKAPASKATQSGPSALFQKHSRSKHEVEWATKYAPQNKEALAVHKKKVEAVESWLLQALHSLQGKSDIAPCSCCCISGPAGSARSTTLRLLAKENNCVIEEWRFPTTTLWAEHKHLRAGGPDYISKLAAFEEIVDRAKLSSLNLTAVTARGTPGSSAPSSQTQVQPQRDQQASASAVVDLTSADAPRTEQLKSSTRPPLRIRLLADFPHVSGSEGCEQLRELLIVLCQSVRMPTFVLVTESVTSVGQAGGADEAVSAGNAQKRYRNLEHMIIDTLEAAGAAHIRFNPLTERTCLRELRRIAKAESLAVHDADLTALVQDAHCDLHNAIQGLALRSFGSMRKTAAKRAKASTSKAHAQDQARDIGLNLFHALGKILYNKRLTADGQFARRGAQTDAGAVTIVSNSQGAASPTKATAVPSVAALLGAPADSPEDVAARSGLNATVVTGFLFENYLDFIDNEAIEDVAAASAEFSDAMRMITSNPGGQWVDPEFETRSPADAVASALACRGYMWANQHPSPSRWRPLRAPTTTSAARAAARNRAELIECATLARGDLELATQSAVLVVPYARLVLAGVPDHPARALLPVRWQKLWHGAIVEEHGGGVPAQNSGPIAIAIGAAGASTSSTTRLVEAVDEIED